MTPHRERRKGKPVGTYILDRTIRGVGRIKVASGTTHLATFNRLNEMIGGLRERGRLDVLRAIMDGVLTPLVVWDAYRVNRLDLLPSAEMLIPLLSAYDEFVGSHESGEKHRASMYCSGLYIATHATDKTPVTELPKILATVRGNMKGNTHRSFNLLRSHCQAFARVKFGRHSTLWHQITAIDPLRVTPTKARRPQEVVGLFVLTEKMAPDVRAVVWSMATTGMGPSEYWGEWERRPGHLHIEGTKRPGRIRDIPDLGYCVVPPMPRWRFEDELAEQSGRALSPYDLRRTFAHWMEAAQILRSRRKMYLGHGTTDVTGLYEKHEVMGFIAEDTAKLKAYIEERRPKTLELVSEIGKSGP